MKNGNLLSENTYFRTNDGNKNFKVLSNLKPVRLKGKVTGKKISGNLEKFTFIISNPATTMAVSAPLNIKVRCVPHSRNYTLIYVLVALISLLIIVILLVRKYRTPVVDRDKARLKALKEKIKKEEKGKKRK